MRKEATKVLGSTSIKDKISRAVWSLAWLIFVRPFCLPIFRQWRNIIFRLFGANIHQTALIYSSARVWAPWNLTMGEGSRIGPHAIIYNVAPIYVGKYTVVSQYAFLCTASHVTDEVKDGLTPLVVSSIRVCDYAWIAASAYVHMGCSIGEGAIVGAASAVFHPVEPWSIVGGNPARFIKKRKIK